MAIDPDVEVLLTEIRAKQAATDSAVDFLTEVAQVLAGRVDKLEKGASEPPAPAAAPPVFGVTVTSANDAAEKRAKFTNTVKAIRHFMGSTLSGGAWMFEQAREYVHISWKPNQTNPADWGRQADAWVSATVPKGRRVYITPWHEPEGNTPSGMTKEAWKANWRAGVTSVADVCAVLRAEGWDVHCTPVICDWHIASWATGDRDWVRGRTDIQFDVLGVDIYPIGQAATGTNHIARLTQVKDYELRPYRYMTLPADILAVGAAGVKSPDCWFNVEYWSEYAKSIGKPWVIPEIGVVRGDPGSESNPNNTQYRYSLEQRAGWITEAMNHIVAPRSQHPPEFVTYYDYGQTQPGCRLLTPEAIAAYDQFVARPYPTGDR